MEWKLFNDGRQILEGKGFYISYNPLAMSAHNIGETALVHGNNNSRRFYILEGDWTDKYTEVAPLGYKACKALFTKNKAHIGFWSN